MFRTLSRVPSSAGLLGSSVDRLMLSHAPSGSLMRSPFPWSAAFMIVSNSIMDRTFKFFRLAAINYIVQGLSKDSPAARIRPASLAIGAICIHMLNALLRRPDDRFAEATLADLCAMKISDGTDIRNGDTFRDDRDGPFHPIGSALGWYTVCDVIRNTGGQWWRIPPSAVIDHTPEARVLLLLYRTRTQADLEYFLNAVGRMFRPRAKNPTRIRNKMQLTSPISLVNPEAIQPLNWGLHARGIRLVDEPVFEDAPDEDLLGQPNRDGRDIFLAPNANVDSILDNILAQFAYDIIQRSPNQKYSSQGAYCTLTQEQQMLVTIDLFKGKVLPFERAWLRFSIWDDWVNMVNCLFPDIEQAPITNPQNYGSCRYFYLWDRLMRNLGSPGDRLEVRRAVARHIASYHWLPYANSDRIWQSKVQNSGTVKYEGPPPSGPAPLIALTPRVAMPNHGTHFGNPYPAQAPPAPNASDGDDDDDDDYGNGPNAFDADLFPRRAPQNQTPGNSRRPTPRPRNESPYPLPPTPGQMPRGRDAQRAPRDPNPWRREDEDEDEEDEHGGEFQPRGHSRRRLPPPRRATPEDSDSDDPSRGEFQVAPHLDDDQRARRPPHRRIPAARQAAQHNSDDDEHGEFEPAPYTGARRRLSTAYFPSPPLFDGYNASPSRRSLSYASQTQRASSSKHPGTGSQSPTPFFPPPSRSSSSTPSRLSTPNVRRQTRTEQQASFVAPLGQIGTHPKLVGSGRVRASSDARHSMQASSSAKNSFVSRPPPSSHASSDARRSVQASPSSPFTPHLPPSSHASSDARRSVQASSSASRSLAPRPPPSSHASSEARRSASASSSASHSLAPRPPPPPHASSDARHLPAGPSPSNAYTLSPKTILRSKPTQRFSRKGKERAVTPDDCVDCDIDLTRSSPSPSDADEVIELSSSESSSSSSDSDRGPPRAFDGRKDAGSALKHHPGASSRLSLMKGTCLKYILVCTGLTSLLKLP